MKDLRKVLASCLIAMVITAPSTYAQSLLSDPIAPTPLNYDVLFSLDSGSMDIAFKRVANGYLMWRADRPTARPRLLTDAEIARFAVVQEEKGSGWAWVRAAMPDGLGGNTEFVISETLTGDGIRGEIEAKATGVVVPYTVRYANASNETGRGPRLRQGSDWIIVIGAGVVLAAGCVINAISTDCASECSSACGTSGMKESDEGLCGQCSCTCKAT